VTGGAGFIGSHIVRALVRDGQQVHVFDDFSRGHPASIPREVTIHQGDIRHLEELMEACENVDEVIHLAYVNGTRTFYDDPCRVLDIGVRGVVNLLDACCLCEIPRLMLVSSSEVCQTDDMSETAPLTIPDPHNPRFSYSAGKIISEMMAIHCGFFEWMTIVRPFNVYGPGMPEGHVIPDFKKKLEERESPFTIVGDGSQTRSFCYVDDFVDGFMMVRARGEHNGIYNVGTPEEISIRDLARLMLKIYGEPMSRQNIQEKYQLRDGSIARRKPDISKIAALGYRPKVSLTEGLRRTMCQ
jgi:nucleoside-diphosphate-sugar epimerase